VAFSLAYTAEKGTCGRGPIHLIVDYLVCLGSLLHSNKSSGVIQLIIMAKVCHYGCSSVFPFNGIDEFGLRQNRFY
jgi:hypothetical protein